MLNQSGPSRKGPKPPESLRIAKLLARMGIASRRTVDAWIQQGEVRINGKAPTAPFCWQPGDEVRIRGLVVVAAGSNPNLPRDPSDAINEAMPQGNIHLWAVYKPRGWLVSHFDPQGRPCMFDNLPQGPCPAYGPNGIGGQSGPHLPDHVVAVGRLDMMSEGLMLLSNHGGLAGWLAHPDQGLERTYHVKVHRLDVARANADGPSPEHGTSPAPRRVETMERVLAQGFTSQGITYRPANMRWIKGESSWLRITLSEGKNREVRHMMEAFGFGVKRLVRIGFGHLCLTNALGGPPTNFGPSSFALEDLQAGQPVWLDPSLWMDQWQQGCHQA